MCTLLYFSVSNLVLFTNSFLTVMLCFSVSSDLHTLSHRIQSLSGESSGLAGFVGLVGVRWWEEYCVLTGRVPQTCMLPSRLCVSWSQAGIPTCVLWTNPVRPVGTLDCYLQELVLCPVPVLLRCSFLVYTPGFWCVPTSSTFPCPHSCSPNLKLIRLAIPSTNATNQLPCWAWLWAECKGIFYLDVS